MESNSDGRSSEKEIIIPVGGSAARRRLTTLSFTTLLTYGRTLPTGARIAMGFVALNLSLFVPLYLLYSHENNFWPFFPMGHPRGAYDWGGSGLGRSTYEYAMQLFVRRHNKDIFRVSADWILIFSSLVVASRFATEWRRTALSLAWVAYAALLTFLVYSALIQDLFGRPGALLDDILLLESAWIFIEQSWGWTDYLYVGLWVVAVAGFGTLLARYLKAVWQWGAQRNPRHVIVGGAVLSAYCLLSLSWFGVGRDDPLIQLQAKQVFNNWQRSQLVLATVDALNNTSLQSAARLAETIPVRRPDIFLFEVESYGATLWADDDYAVAREGLMRRVESELATLQLPMLSRFATSPVYGGGSWMSKASALSGMKIETHSTYSAWTKLASRYPHLIAYLNRQGYYTLAIQPASLSVAGLYDYDDVIVRSDLSYNGFFYGFGHVPDQWSLEYAFENHWSRGPRPRLFHFSAVSTHFAWESPPRITEDVAALEEPQPSFLETQPYYVELALTVPQGRKRDYFVTIAYEWELMLEAFRHRIEPGFIALIYGDHQPPFIAGGRGGNDVAVHVVTDIPDLPGPLATAGFTAGGGIAWTRSASEEFRIEAFYSFIVSLLSTEDGSPLEYSPHGIALPIVRTW